MESPTDTASEPADPAQRALMRRRRRGRMLHWLVLLASALVRRLPLRVARAIGRSLGALAWHVAPRERRIALRNISAAFPDWSGSRRRDTIQAMFRHLGVSLFEILWLPNLDAPTIERTTIVEGLGPLLDLVDAGHGVVVFSGHCGNWEWLAYTVGMAGRPVTVLQRERNEAELNQFITAMRLRAGVRTIDRGSTAAGRELIQAVRSGGFLAFLIDQNIRTESVKIPFFGVPALTPIGPAKLAIRTGAHVVSAFIERREDGMQVIRFHQSHSVSRGDDPIALTTALTGDIEEQIRRVPEQWVWFHERWRERPEWDVANKRVAGSE